ncbi:MAG: hypothetical protein H7240_12790 [Glaciimonas sp.]|nr:hypothetical protein [Glaciimonas sp.]
MATFVSLGLIVGMVFALMAGDVDITAQLYWRFPQYWSLGQGFAWDAAEPCVTLPELTAFIPSL